MAADPRSGARGRRASIVAAALLLAVAAAPAAAQGAPADSNEVHGTIFERLNLDRLRFSALGVAAGAIRPTKAEATSSYTVLADYGEIAPRWHVLFTATYWSSHIKQKYVDVLRDTLSNSITDPTSDYTLDLGRVRLSDIALITDVHYTPLRFRTLQPYLGAGLGAHIVNAEGRAINGTLVEQALDNITTGIAGMAGAELTLFRHLALGAQARFDLLSAARFASVRASGTYIFDPTPRRAR